MARNTHEIVAGQFPEFIRSTPEYSKFLNFIEDYYLFLGELDVKESRDIDTTDFISNYFNELAINFPEIQKLNDKQQRLILMKMQELYKSKGSADSYKIIFNILFNKDVEIFYPSTQMFKPSAAKWNRDVSVRFTLTSGSISETENVPCSIITENRTYDLDISRIRLLNGNIYEAIFDIRFDLDIPNGGTIVAEGFSGKLVYGIVNYDVRLPGSGFVAGSIFEIDNSEGTGTKIRIKRVSSGGGIRNIEIFEFGTGYQTPFFHLLTPESALIINEQNNLSITVTGTEPSIAAYPTDDKVNRLRDTFIASRYDYTESLVDTPFIPDYFEDNTYVGEQLAEISNIATQILDDTTNKAVIFFSFGYVHKYPGYFSNNIGFPDDSSYIQDGFYYQQYSYVLQSTEELDAYKKPILNLLHPAGTKLFGEYRIESNLELLINIRNILNRFAFVFNEILSITDEQIQFNVIKNLNDVVEPLEELAKELSKPLDDIVEPEDQYVATLTKYIFDTVTMIDEFDPETSIANVVNDSYTDETSISDEPQLTLTKQLEDIVTSLDIINIELNKIIVDIVEPTDEFNFEVEKNLSDEALAQEEISKEVSKGFDDEYSVSDLVGKILTKEFADSVTIDDLVEYYRILLEEPSDSSTVNDEISYDVTKNTSEALSIIEEILFNINKNISEELIVNEVYSASIDKPVEDDTTIISYGVVAMPPYYYEIDGLQYWEGGYFENETQIS